MISMYDQIVAFTRPEGKRDARIKYKKAVVLNLIKARPMFAREIADALGLSTFSVYLYVNELQADGQATYDLVKSIGKSPQKRWRATNDADKCRTTHRIE